MHTFEATGRQRQFGKDPGGIFSRSWRWCGHGGRGSNSNQKILVQTMMSGIYGCFVCPAEVVTDDISRYFKECLLFEQSILLVNSCWLQSQLSGWFSGTWWLLVYPVTSVKKKNYRDPSNYQPPQLGTILFCWLIPQLMWLEIHILPVTSRSLFMKTPAFTSQWCFKLL